MRVFAIDPGNTHSAFVLYDSAKGLIELFGYLPNPEFLDRLPELRSPGEALAIEYPQPRGQPMYSQLVDTIFWIGRFVQAVAPYGDWTPVDRKDVKMTLCGGSNAKDPSVRAAVISRFEGRSVPGVPNPDPVGTKRAPGPLYGVSGDVWAALAVAITHAELNAAEVLTNALD